MNTHTRRNVLAGLAASVAASPSAAFSATSRDAELAGLGLEHDRLSTIIRDLNAAAKVADQKFHELVGEPPKALEKRSEDEAFNFPGYPVCEWDGVTRYGWGSLEPLKAFDGQTPGWSRATADGASIVVPAQAAAEGWQARRDEIVAAVEAWEAKRSRAFMDSGTLAVEDALEAALAERGEIEEAIISQPARTLAGLLVKARAAMNSAMSLNPGDGTSSDLALAWSVARDLASLEAGR